LPARLACMASPQPAHRTPRRPGCRSAPTHWTRSRQRAARSHALPMPRTRRPQRTRLVVVGHEAPDHLLFFTRNGTPLTTNYIRRRLRAVLSEAGIDAVTPCAFRRTVATVLDRASGPDLAGAVVGCDRASGLLPASATVLSGRAFEAQRALAIGRGAWWDQGGGGERSGARARGSLRRRGAIWRAFQAWMQIAKLRPHVGRTSPIWGISPCPLSRRQRRAPIVLLGLSAARLSDRCLRSD
jgi:integrase